MRPVDTQDFRAFFPVIAMNLVDAEGFAAIADPIGVTTAFDMGDGVKQPLDVAAIHARCRRRRHSEPGWNKDNQANG
jgi:hypothetical protein